MPNKSRFGVKSPSLNTPIQVILQTSDISYSVVTSTPPQGMFKITNLYYDPVINRIIIQYDDSVGGN